MASTPNFSAYKVPFKTDKKYSKAIAYFSMEFAIDQPLKIYSGGLGFLAGSHMRSAFELKQNLVGIGMLWKYGYYDQVRNTDRSMGAQFVEKVYNFLQDTGIRVTIDINNHPVVVAAYYLSPDVFQSAPMFLLSTDVPENDFLARSTCNKLYDQDSRARIAQNMVLGLGGAKVLDALGFNPHSYHFNEAHALPAAFHLLKKHDLNVEKVKEQLVFTTHTPEDAGNERHPMEVLLEMGFFNGIERTDIERICGLDKGVFNHTLAGLRMARKANAVSKLHGEVSRNMWNGFENICQIGHITNAQNETYWADKELYAAKAAGDDAALMARKREMKANFFKIVADQTGKILNPDALTIVWARRFAGYKRPDLLLNNLERLNKLVNDTKQPLQIIWAGKPYPFDFDAQSKFNKLVYFAKDQANCAVLTGYELALSKAMKQGADIWLNTPRITREASGTSGMTSAMNGGVNFSTWDGWICEFGEHKKNAYIIPALDYKLPTDTQDEQDLNNLFDILENDIIKTYYAKDKKAWASVVKNSMTDVIPFFGSNRMADEYYSVLYNS